MTVEPNKITVLVFETLIHLNRLKTQNKDIPKFSNITETICPFVYFISLVIFVILIINVF